MAGKTEKKELSGVEKKALFEAYAKADTAHNAAKTAMEAAFDSRSKAVKAIFEACGIGPFNYKGRILTVVKRMKGAEKNEAGEKIEGTGEASYFFKSPSSSEVQEIG